MVEQGGYVDFLAWKPVLTAAGLKGIGVYFSSGDGGDEGYPDFGIPPSADFPASSDLVTAVGGTSLALGQTGNLVFETGWATGASFLDPATSADADAGTVGDAGDVGSGSSGLLRLRRRRRLVDGVRAADLAEERRAGFVRGAGGRRSPHGAGRRHARRSVHRLHRRPDRSGQRHVLGSRHRRHVAGVPAVRGDDRRGAAARGQHFGFANPLLYKHPTRSATSRRRRPRRRWRSRSTTAASRRSRSTTISRRSRRRSAGTRSPVSARRTARPSSTTSSSRFVRRSLGVGKRPRSDPRALFFARARVLASSDDAHARRVEPAASARRLRRLRRPIARSARPSTARARVGRRAAAHASASSPAARPSPGACRPTSTRPSCAPSTASATASTRSSTTRRGTR